MKNKRPKRVYLDLKNIRNCIIKGQFYTQTFKKKEKVTRVTEQKKTSATKNRIEKKEKEEARLRKLLFFGCYLRTFESGASRSNRRNFLLSLMLHPLSE